VVCAEQTEQASPRVRGHNNAPVQLSLSRLWGDIETLVGAVTSDEHDVYQSTVCPNCQQLHSVNPANGEILVEDGLGDPW